VKRPDGTWVTEATSVSNDNNYEIVSFVARHSGQYQIVIRKYSATESTNFLGTALVMIPAPYGADLPLIMNQ
jgi:hypothetical protein